MPAPRKAEKAPHPLAINDGSAENGAGPKDPPASQEPPREPEASAPATSPQAQQQSQPQAGQDPNPGPYVVELATVEALMDERLAKLDRGNAGLQLGILALAGAAFLIALAAYKRAMVAEAEAMLEGGE